MWEDKPFLNPDLSLPLFAEHLNCDAKEVSAAIRAAHRCSFPEFINRARVEEAKRLINEPQWQGRSLLDIGLAAGFNSKSSFNLMFKRLSGATPTQYRNNLASAS